MTSESDIEQSGDKGKGHPSFADVQHSVGCDAESSPQHINGYRKLFLTTCRIFP